MNEIPQSRELIVWVAIWLCCPVVLIICVARLRKLKREAAALLQKESVPQDEIPLESEISQGEDYNSPFPAKEETFAFPPAKNETRTTFSSDAPAQSNEMLDRLDSMSKRLNEMQTVLNKQLSAPTSQPTGIGQGFSPETIDKLIKIIGNVTQQVEVLQKSMTPSKSNANDKTAPRL